MEGLKEENAEVRVRLERKGEMIEDLLEQGVEPKGERKGFAAVLRAVAFPKKGRCKLRKRAVERS